MKSIRFTTKNVKGEISKPRSLSVANFKNWFNKLPKGIIRIETQVREPNHDNPITIFETTAEYKWIRSGINPLIDVLSEAMMITYPEKFTKTKNGVWYQTR